MRKKTLLLVGLITAALFSGIFWGNFGVGAASVQNNKKESDIGNIGGASEYNARNEFALTQGGTTGVWRYGYSASQTDNAFTEFTANDTVNACGGQYLRWAVFNSDTVPQIGAPSPGTNCSNIVPDSLFIHPGPTVLGGGDASRRAVVRWIAPAAGTFQLTGTLQRSNLSATVDLKIIKNAASMSESVVFSGSNVSTFQIAYNVTVTVAQGETLDFSVGDGGAYQSDGANIVINISQPATACLTAPANLQVFVPGENSPSDVQSVNTNASLVGDASYTNTGKVGRAFDLDGAGDYVRIEDNAAQRPTTALTLEGWFKFDTASGTVSLISKPIRGSVLNSYTLYLDGGKLRGLVGNASQYNRVNSDFAPQTGVWHHLAFTYNFSGTSSTLKLYANGTDVTTIVDNNGIGNLQPTYDANPYPLLIGGEFENNNPQFFLDGQADEISVYGRALSQPEIFDIVQQNGFGKCKPAPCAQTPNNLVSWFAGDQNALDSRSNNHGALVNGTTFQTAKVGQGFKFDGVDDRVEIPDSPSLKPQNLTVETWVKFDSLSSNTSGGAPNGTQYLVFKKNQAAVNFEGFVLNKTSSNTFRFGFGQGNGNPGVVVDSTTAATTGVFYHVVGTYDGSSVKIYVNGQLEATAPYNLPLNYDTRPLFLGTSGESNFDGKFNGVLDEVSIYNRALSASEITAISNAGQSGKCKPVATNPAANQVAWFTGDGDARDFTGLNSAGTLQGNTNYKVGRVGQSFNFDGSGDYVSTADSANWDFGTGDFAIEAWFNAPNPTGTQRIISAGSQADGGNNLWSWGYGDNGDWGGGQRLNFAVYNGSGYSDFSSSPVTFRPNTWHHAAVVRSGTSFTFYLDGVSVGTVPVGAGFTINGGSTGAIIGARYNQNPASIFEYANGRLDEISVYKRALTDSEIAAVYNAGSAGKLKEKIVSFVTLQQPAASEKNTRSVNTENGGQASTTVELSSATVTFSNVTSAGTVSQSGVDLAFLPALPSWATFTGIAQDVSTTAGYSGSVTVCFKTPSLPSGTFSQTQILHLEGGSWVNRTTTRTYPQICAQVSSLSPFAIVQGLAPTAASVSVGGRVVNQTGSGIPNVRVTIADAEGQTATTITNGFGQYRFENVQVGEVYFVSVSSKRYEFAQNTQAVNVLESIDNVNFTASSNSLSSETSLPQPDAVKSKP
jgi:hypothetical protein